MYATIIIAAGLLGLAQAQSYTPPGAQTFGALYTPDVSHPVTQGSTFNVTWDPTGHTTDGSTVSLVLCRGGGGNCVNAPTAIVSGVPAKNAQYSWNVPCDLAVGTQSTSTGYGMLIIVDGTGQFQYSTQFSVLAGSKCGSSSSTTTSGTSGSSTTTSKSSGSTTMMTTTSSKAYTTSAWSDMSNNYTHTSPLPTQPAPQTTVEVVTTSAIAIQPTASATPTVFKGAAVKIGGSATALLMAAGAAFFAL